MKASARVLSFRFAAALLLLSSALARAQVVVKALGQDQVNVTIAGQPFTDFHIARSNPKPYLAPLRSATGKIVSRSYPMENVEGESRDHQHHRGLWIGYGSINGVNFWENELNYQTNNRGKILLHHLDKTSSGKKIGTIKASFDWLGPSGALMLIESRTMTFTADQELRLIDFDVTFTARTKVTFEDTKEGFFAIRIADSMAEKNGGLMTNSEGAQTEKNVWGKRANWVDYEGTVEGERIGIVLFDHPGNFNHPSHWHSRAYGLFAINPFGLKDFEPKSTAKGGEDLASGRKLRFRYRVIIHPGDVSKKQVADWYASYVKTN